MQVEQSSLLNENSKIKIVFLGDSSVGKTSIVQYISTGCFNATCDPTVYLDSVRKNVVHKGKIARLVLWDTAGQQKFNSLVPSSIRGAQCAIIVFSVGDRASFQKCQFWIKMLKDCSNGAACPTILVGNKTDLKRNVQQNQAFEFANKNGMGYVETSAKSGKNIENLLSVIIDCVDEKLEKSTNSSEGNGSQKGSKKQLKGSETNSKKSIVLSDKNINFKKQNGCCCAI